MRQRSTSLHSSPQYQPFLEGCRLLGVRAVLGHTPCKELVTALIERWRPETNTFHLVPGEATITLEDLEVLTGLPTTGRPLIVSPDERHVTDIYEQWLGVQPPHNAIQGRTVRVSWVKRLFDRLLDGATVEVITYHARAYTWVLVGFLHYGSPTNPPSLPQTSAHCVPSLQVDMYSCMNIPVFLLNEIGKRISIIPKFQRRLFSNDLRCFLLKLLT
ncbi:Protein MAIN-LIKE 2 [Linum perenne]